MEEAELRWLEALRSRNEEAVRRLVVTFGEPLRRYLAAMLRSPADGEDLAQEVFLRFLDGLDRFRGEASVKTYLFTIAHNLALNHLASSARAHEVFPGEVPDGPSGSAGPSHEVLAGERAEALRSALALLPPQQRSVVVLRTWQDLSFKEIGSTMGLAEGTVKAHYFFALRNLRRQMEAAHDA